jgi:iduronate 2-sulfatase
LKEHEADRFFVFLHLFDPHDPYQPRTPFDTQWADEARLPAHEEEATRAKAHIADPALKEIGLPTRSELEAAGVDAQEWAGYERDWYDGSILGMDQEIARLMQGMREMGLLQKTLVVFTSDHGEEFLDHGRMWHGQSVYGELTHVPLIFFGAGVPKPGSLIEEPVRSIDIMPTLLELFDLRAPAQLQGESLVPLLRSAAGLASNGEEWLRKPIVTQKAATHDERLSPPPRKAGMVAISDGKWKLIHNEPREEGKPEWELYDRETDPLDRHDVAAEHPDVVERLQQDLAAWRAEVERVQLKAGSTQALDAESLRAMRAMGYSK